MDRAQGGGATSSGPAAGLGHEIILQGFNWESHRGHGWYKVLKEQVPDIAAAGFSAIWLPPPSESVSPQGCARGLPKPYSTYAQKPVEETPHRNGRDGCTGFVNAHSRIHLPETLLYKHPCLVLNASSKVSVITLRGSGPRRRLVVSSDSGSDADLHTAGTCQRICTI